MKTNGPLEPLLKEAKSVIRKRIVVLTGAGVSAESGVPRTQRSTQATPLPRAL